MGVGQILRFPLRTTVRRSLTTAAVLALCELGPSAGQAQIAPLKSRPLPPGRMIDIGGHRLHLFCTGRGTPTVVLIHGFGGYAFDWFLVQKEVAHSARVCSYDRAGQAWSDRGPAPRGLRRITDELHTLLQKSGEMGPFVLVGQSWGGLIPRLYLPEHRREVAGVVFVDASHEDMWMWLNGLTLQARFAPDTLWDRIWPRRRALPAVDTSSRPVGPETAPAAPDTSTPKLDPPFDRLPKEVQRLRAWAQSVPAAGLAGGDWNDVREDFRDVARTSGTTLHPFGRIPVFVLSAGEDDFENEKEASAATQRSQFERGHLALAKLSTNSRRLVAAASGHLIQLEEPDLVVEAIRQVLESARTGKPLCCR